MPRRLWSLNVASFQGSTASKVAAEVLGRQRGRRRVDPAAAMPGCRISLGWRPTLVPGSVAGLRFLVDPLLEDDRVKPRDRFRMGQAVSLKAHEIWWLPEIASRRFGCSAHGCEYAHQAPRDPQFVWLCPTLIPAQIASTSTATIRPPAAGCGAGSSCWIARPDRDH